MADNVATDTRSSAYGNPLNMGPIPSSRRAESVASERGDEGQYMGAQGMTRADMSGTPLLGRPANMVDKRKYKYDVHEGKKANLSFYVTRDDRMSAEEAGIMMEKIHGVMGLHGADPSIMLAFDNGLFFCHTVNGGSVLNPGRATWQVPGKTEDFKYADVRDMLGVELRRFFRAYADDIAAANRKVLSDYDPNDIIQVEHRGWLLEVAQERGIQRYPYLAHDSADACTRLNFSERNALILSKSMTISASVNSADSMRNTSRILSADAYDSTNGRSIQADKAV